MTDLPISILAQGIKQHTLPAVEHHPEYDKLESNEDWDAGILLFYLTYFVKKYVFFSEKISRVFFFA